MEITQALGTKRKKTVESNNITTRMHYGTCGSVIQAFFHDVEQPALTVTFVHSGIDFVITQYVVAPNVTVKEAEAASDAIDLVLEAEAAKLAVRNLFLIHPNDTAELVRTYQAKPFLMGLPATRSTAVYIN